MRVTALLYTPPGRGEYVTQHFDMPDGAMPTSTEEFTARSLKALNHFWPNLRPTPALKLDECSGRTVVHGQHWSVSWAAEETTRRMESFIEKELAGVRSVDELLALDESIRPIRQVNL